MAWPCRQQLWGEGLDAARRGYAAVAQTIARFEPVTMIAQPDQLAQASLYCGPGIAVLPMPHDDSWTRDTGPTFLADGKGTLAGVAWRFNGWGELYADYGQDAQMARRVLEHLEARRFTSAMVLEGGAIHVDGEGTCLACTPSILDPKRNPGLGMADAEAELRAQLGVEKVIWLPAALIDDETAGISTISPASPGPGSCLRSAPTTRPTPTIPALPRTWTCCGRPPMPKAGSCRS